MEKDGKYLLQLRSNTKKILHPNMWGLFGGVIEKGETPIKAAVREIKEELNLELKKESVKKVVESINDEREIFIFKSQFEKDLSKLELNEGQDMKLFTKEEIYDLKNATPGLKKLIEKLKNNSL